MPTTAPAAAAGGGVCENRAQESPGPEYSGNASNAVQLYLGQVCTAALLLLLPLPLLQTLTTININVHLALLLYDNNELAVAFEVSHTGSDGTLLGCVAL